MKKRNIWILAFAAVAAAAVAFSLTQKQAAVPVDLATVSRGDLEVAVAEEGKTRLRKRYVVSAPVAGLITRIELEEGDAVTDETVITSIYHAPENERDMLISQAVAVAAQARRNEAISSVAELQTRIKHLQRENERSQKLRSAGAITEEEAEKSELAFEAATKQLAAAQAQVNATTADAAAAQAAIVKGAPGSSSGTPIYVTPPVAGVVLAVLEKSQRVVQAGTPLIEIGDPTKLELVIDVLSEDAVGIKVGDRVLLENWGGSGPLQATVRGTEPLAFTKISALGVEEQRVNVIADLSTPSPSLAAGYRVEANIITWSGKGVLLVPTSALFQKDGSWRTFAVRAGKATSVVVKIGHRATERAEVLEGLSEGEQVIVFPSAEIEDGVLVGSATP